VRLLTFVRKATEQARADPTHPAYALATSETTTKSFERISEYLAQGFAKHQGDGQPLQFGEALKRMTQAHMAMQEESEAAADSNSSISGISDEEKATMEKTATTAAMMSMVNVDLNEEERGHLYALAEIEGDSEGSDASAIVEEQMNGIDDILQSADDGDFANIAAQETFDDEEDDDEIQDIDTEASETTDASLIETAGRGQVVQPKEKVGPLKWLFKHGLGWIIARVAWLALFSVGAVLGVIRGAVIFPLLFVSCTLLKFASWLFNDFGYDYLWNGDTGAFSRFGKIGQCAPAMWDAVGFDASVENTASQIFVQPATFASQVTGVHHVYRASESLCAGVDCGENASCHGGQCYCRPGFYPPSRGMSPSDCVPATTQAGCKCQGYWYMREAMGLYSSSHYGCSTSRGKCVVNTQDQTYGTCRGKLTYSQDGVLASGVRFLMGVEKQTIDYCRPVRSDGKVPPRVSRK